MLPKALIVNLWNVLYTDQARTERVARSETILRKLLGEAGIDPADDPARPDPVHVICENLCLDGAPAASGHACPPLVQRTMELSRDAGLPIPSQVAAVFARKAAQEAVNFTPPTQFPDAFKNLKKLAAHYALVLTANTSLPGGAGLREVLDGDHLLQFFRATFFSDERGAGLPSPTLYRTALDFFQLEPRDVWVVVGHSLREVPPARSLRLPTVMVARTGLPPGDEQTPGVAGRPDIAPVESVSDLPGLVQRLKAD